MTQILQRLAAAYEANEIAPLGRDAERACLLEALDLQPGHVVLDAGAWDGYLAEKLAAHRGRVILMERVREFTDRLRERFPRKRVLVGQQERIPLPAASIDRVAALVALHHVDSIGFMHEARRVLRIGGRLAVVEVGRGTPVSEWLDRHVHEMTPRGHRGRYLSVDEWRRCLAIAGFTACDVRLVRLHWSFRSMAQAVAYCRAIFGLETSDARIAEAIEALTPLVTPDSVRWDWPLLRITADV